MQNLGETIFRVDQEGKIPYLKKKFINLTTFFFFYS